DSSTSPSRGSSTGAEPRFTAQQKPGSRNSTSTSSGASPQVSEPSPSASSSRRSRRAALYSDRVEAGSRSWTSRVSDRHWAGTGSQLSSAGQPKPNGGSSPSQGIGTRHPSRPRSVRPERSQVGSCNASSGRSVTSGSPSSSPW